MGACASRPSGPASAAPRYDDGHAPQPQRNPWIVKGHQAGAVSPVAGPPAAATAAGVSAGANLVHRIHELQQDLGLLSTQPLLALSEAAELLVARMGVDFAGVCAYPACDPDCDVSCSDWRLDSAPDCCAVLLAASGAGAGALSRHTVMRGRGWAAACLAAGGATRLAVPDAARREADPPRDFSILHRSAGLRSFAAVLIGPPAHPFGVLLLGRRAPNGFDDDWSAVWPPAAATALLQRLRSSQAAQAVASIRAIEAAQDPVDAISAALSAGSRFLFAAANVPMRLRLALLLPPPPGGCEAGAALVFEPASSAASGLEFGGCSGGGGGSSNRLSNDSTRTAASAQSNCGGGSYTSGVLLAEQGADVAVRELPLANTLLAGAISLGKARFVSDVSSYLQNCPNPARDVLTHASRPVSSIVVVPLLAAPGGGAFGALYFSHEDAPCDFSNVQEPILGFVHAVTPALHAKLAGRAEELKATAAEGSCKDASVSGSVRDGSAHGGAFGPRAPAGAPGSALASAAAPRARASTGRHVIFEISSSESEADDGEYAAAGRDDDYGGTAEDFKGAEPSGWPNASPSGPGSTGGLEASSVSASFASGSAARLSKVSARRLCTEAMMRVLQHDIRRSRRRSLELEALSDLQISEPLGHGGYGCVFRGTWHGVPAAIKVMHARQTNAAALSDAMEMAVLSSVAHPGIVQVYSCLTDMVLCEGEGGSSIGSSWSSAIGSSIDFEGICNAAPPAAAAAAGFAAGRAPDAPRAGAGFAAAAPGAGAGAGTGTGAAACGGGGLLARGPRFRHLLPGEESEAPVYNIICMEYADGGTLKDAIARGAFHRRLPSGAVGVDLAAVLEVLIDLAHSLDYLHSSNLLHGDVKLDNVLLKSEAGRRMGFVCKLADFGLCRILSDDVINHSGAGTVDHLAPEMLYPGTRVTSAVDVYAFGITLYEIYTGRAPYPGLSAEATAAAVRGGARPTFPPGAPASFAQLASACWTDSAEARPAFGEVVAALRRMAARVGVAAPPQPQPQQQQQQQQQQPQPQRPRPPAAAAAAAAAAAMAAAELQAAQLSAELRDAAAAAAAAATAAAVDAAKRASAPLPSPPAAPVPTPSRPMRSSATPAAAAPPPPPPPAALLAPARAAAAAAAALAGAFN
ncbi:hypothetical protein Rsub_03089 [Raphidocelis subcapitata]|uniref:Protein kinase domain-containing protein n=1 Tax=Raphidocelis subcapitata TaxID=307507 RepID=A0A2V0NSY3_9CHLO|nr:hypothetical protein Rsub_03089 [Raphidocelis subcapitata]|eukprot:GBF90788.1 hypothetical protein Rsub_03089 [Raphidocelis subcapitata]